MERDFSETKEPPSKTVSKKYYWIFISDSSYQATLLTALRAGPPFSWGVTSGGPPGGRSLSKDGTRADSANDFCRLVGGV